MSSCEESGKVKGSFPSLINSVDRQEKKKKKKTKEKEKKTVRGKKKRKMERVKEKIFSVFQRSELDSPKTKVGPHNESYAWGTEIQIFRRSSKR